MPRVTQPPPPPRRPCGAGKAAPRRDGRWRVCSVSFTVFFAQAFSAFPLMEVNCGPRGGQVAVQQQRGRSGAALLNPSTFLSSPAHAPQPPRPYAAHVAAPAKREKKGGGPPARRGEDGGGTGTR